MTDLVITVALRSEIPPSLIEEKILPIIPFKDLKLRNTLPETCIVITGVGEQNARYAAEQILRFKPQYVLNVGTCGRINTQIPEQDWVHVMSCYYNHQKQPISPYPPTP